MISRNLKEYFQLAIDEQASLIETMPKENLDLVIEKEHDRILMMAQASSDLDALKKTISYAEDERQSLANRNLASSVCNSGVVSIYDHTPERIRILEELRTRGFGKTVVFVDSSQALRAYRVAQANESCIQGNLVVVNRLARVAAELAPAEVGDIITLPEFGDCEVIAVSLVDRFRSDQSCNFQSLAYDDQDLKSMLTPLIDVVGSLKRWRNMIVGFFEGEKLNTEEQSLCEFVSPSTEHLETSTASLGAQFYTSPTKLQEQIIRRGGRGLLIVQGIAGSGKTSVALGRTKFLCDRRTQPEDDETRDDFFRPETSVGFVLHSQLVDYLKETRDQLFISDMQIMDYNRLRQKLLLQRTGFLQVKLKKDDKGKYSRCNAQEDNCDGTILLLKIADRAIRDAYINQLKASLLSSPDWDIKELKPEHKAILRQIWETVQQKGMEFIENLARPSRNVNYTNDGLAEKIEKFRQSILSLVNQSTRWLSVPIAGRWLSPKNFREVLYQLNMAGYELGHGSDKNQVEFLLATEEQLDQLYKIRDRLFIEGGQTKLPHNISRESLITLLQQEQLVIERDHRWAKIRHHESLFEERITTGKAWIRRKNGNDNWIQIGLTSLFGDNTGSNARRRLSERLRLLLVDSLKLPDLLLTSLNSELEKYVSECSDSAKMRTTLTNMRQRLTDKKLSDPDIDLFLAITHLITDGYQGEVSALKPTSASPALN